MKQLATKYDHHDVEDGRYERWVEAGFYTAGDINKKPYCIVIPPPNVTGKLHLGHAWDNTLQDILARYHRLLGEDVLYLPGMDHAGIATQAKVDQRLREQGINRHEIGREKFLQATWRWKQEYADHIHEQWKKLGLSLDYSRERFTLDEGLSKAVTHVFVTLYQQGLIFQGYRIINWDVQAQTALSNIEVIHKEVKGAFYTFSYKVVETGEKLLVATTRPETMFGDVCLVVHPDDLRYRDVVGKHVINPANGQKIPVITDDYIDMEFGTGVMKCTPAHDPNDFIIGEKYHLDMPVCMNPDGTMNELAGIYEGLDRFACRRRMTEDLQRSGDLVKIEEHVHQVGHSERTDTIVEPYLSKQWFVKMKPLADAVLAIQADPAKRIDFWPERFDKTFCSWLENIEDWCISRQLWWGHRIPAWFHKETGAVYVGEKAPDHPDEWEQDPDVLDTWFSSALWPFSTLGWPDDTEDFARYYPTNVLVTGYDIIFFWVARMAFQGLHFTNQRPFKDVLIHGLIRAQDGRKMSKSYNNGVDPMDVIDQYGVDALRHFLISNSAPGQDLRYDPTKLEASWALINKLWNASRFVFMNIDKGTIRPLSQLSLSPVDRWILAKLDDVIEAVTTQFDRYEFGIASDLLTDFVRNDYCGWYIELCKTGLQSSDVEDRDASISTLVYALSAILRLLHPITPFVTDALWEALPNHEGSIQTSTWPKQHGIEATDPGQVERMIALIETVRSLRTQYGLKPSLTLHVVLHDETGNQLLFSPTMQAMTEKLANLEIVDQLSGTLVTQPFAKGAMAVRQDELVDPEALKQQLIQKQAHLEDEISRARGLLENPRFVSKAPTQKVELERNKLAEYKRQHDIVCEQLDALMKGNK